MKSALHIWSTAGIGAMLCKEMRDRGRATHCVMRSGYDPFSISGYYGYEQRDEPGNEFLNYCLDRAKDFDIIHVHGIHRILPDLWDGKRKIIIHYHGTDLSKCGSYHQRKLNEEFAHKILVSTPDLLQIELEATHLPNPVDTELFKPKKSVRGEALAITAPYIDTESLKGYAKRAYVQDLKIIEREKDNRPYKTMPALLNGYNTYIDCKPYPWTNGIAPDAFSTTGLQALACGLRVLTPHGFEMGLPIEHELKNVVDQLEKIYESL